MGLGKSGMEGALAAHDVGWSHSGDALLLATGPQVQLGVDVERLRPRPRALELAERFFAPAGTQALRALPEHERTGAISFRSFYARRARRLLPAAVLVLAVTVAASGLVLGAARARDTSVDAAWALVFAGNWHVAAEAVDHGSLTDIRELWLLIDDMRAAVAAGDPDALLDAVFGSYDQDTDHPWHRLERGELSLDSEVGRGSRFTLGLPVRPAKAKVTSTASAGAGTRGSSARSRRPSRREGSVLRPRR